MDLYKRCITVAIYTRVGCDAGQMQPKVSLEYISHFEKKTNNSCREIYTSQQQHFQLSCSYVTVHFGMLSHSIQTARAVWQSIHFWSINS